MSSKREEYTLKLSKDNEKYSKVHAKRVELFSCSVQSSLFSPQITVYSCARQRDVAKHNRYSPVT